MSSVPADVVALRETLLEVPAHAERIIDGARALVVGTRFAPASLPAPGAMPYAAERLCGTPFRWLPDGGPEAETHGVDVLGRVVTSTAPGPREHFFAYAADAIQRATLSGAAVVELATTTLCHGRPVGYLEVSRESWLREEYSYDGQGLLISSRQQYHLVATGIPDGVSGRHTDRYVHAADGRLTRVETTVLDQPPTVTFRA